MKRKLNEDDVPEVVGEDTAKATASPKPTFSSLGLDARLLQAIQREKFSAPTPVQTQAIPLALSGKDILARAKTGSGKTLAYLLPILHSLLQPRKSSSSKSGRNTTALILVPTKELATQVTSTLKTFTAFCGNDIRAENLTRKEDVAVTRARMTEAGAPDIVVATPSRANLWVNNEVLKLDALKWLVVDEADLVLNYGYEDDLQNLADALPTAGVQTVMMSATLSPSTTTLASLLCKSNSNSTGGSGKDGPTILDLSATEAAEPQSLSQYVLPTAEEDKFLLIYAIFKLQLIKGKVIIFIAEIDRCYRVKLFLEQFGIRSVVLNQELPVNSRGHVVEEFNRGVWEILVACDEGEVVGEDGARKRRKVEAADEDGDGGEDGLEAAQAGEAKTADHADESAEDDTEPPSQQPTKPKPARQNKKSASDREYSISRGIDFRHIACVLNFDLPLTAKSYTHRTGRTARAGQTGMALSFYVPASLYRKHKSTSIPQCANDEGVLAAIKASEAARGAEVQEWKFDMSKLEGLRYRFGDALRNVTRMAIREARTKELKRELVTSAKLQRHFEENPDELRHLRRDGLVGAGRNMRTMPHLRHVPGYLLPEGGRRAVQGNGGFVGLRGDRERERNGRKGRVGGRGGARKGKGGGRGFDPLRSLKVDRRGSRK